MNIALPATLQANALEWIDMDLDYRLPLDQAEFEQNVQRWRYPPDLIEHTWAA